MANISHFTQTVNGVSTTYDIHDANAVPRSGGAVITGTSLGRADNTSKITLCGGVNNTNGGSITIYGKDSSSTGDITISCTANGTNYYSIRLHSNGIFEHDYTSISRAVNNASVVVCGGKNNSSGASIQLYGKDVTTNAGYAFIKANDGAQSNGFQIKPNGDTLLTDCLAFYPNKDNNTDVGAPAYRYKVIYATTGTINTSDARLKNSVKDINDKLLDAWGNIEPKQYKFNDATEKKGEKARYHTGYLAQDIQAECEKQGVNASDYGLFCYDEWEEQEEKKDENGQVIEPYKPKGDLYSLRYEEALVVECKYLRRCIERLTTRIEELENGNNTK